MDNRWWRGFKNYLADLRRFSRNARLYLLGSFLMGVNMQVFQLLLNLYLKEYGLDESRIGLVVSARSGGMALIAIPAAILLARLPLKTILAVTCALFSIFSVAVIWLQKYELILLFSLLSGITFAFYRVAAGPFYMRNSTPIERTHLFSINFATMIVAGMIGSLGAGTLASWLSGALDSALLGHRYALACGVLASLGALVPFLLLRVAPSAPKEGHLKFSRAQFKARGHYYVKITTINFVIGLGAGLIIPFLNLYFLDRFQLTADSIGACYFGVQTAMLVGSLAAPLLVRRFGLVRTVVIAQLASIPFLLVLSYSYVLSLAVFAFVMRGGLMNIGVPIVNNLGMELSTRSEQGIVNALLLLAWSTSRMVASAVGGWLIETYGYTASMNCTILLYVAASLVFYLFFRDVEFRSPDKPGWQIRSLESA
jgi:predicted MFS family arabinose efflux permease